MLCPQPSGYDFKQHIITEEPIPSVNLWLLHYLPSQGLHLWFNVWWISTAASVIWFCVCVHTMATSAQGRESCVSCSALALLGESCQRAPISCPAVRAHPIKLLSPLKSPADPASGHERNGRTPTDHFIQDRIPMYIRIDIITRGSVDLKVKCHPHQALDEGSSALQKPFYKVNYINYQHLKTSNI